MTCYRCGEKLYGKPKFCPNCGATANAPSPSDNPSTIGLCHRCGKRNEVTAKFCMHCGEERLTPTPVKPSTNQILNNESKRALMYFGLIVVGAVVLVVLLDTSENTSVNYAHVQAQLLKKRQATFQKMTLESHLRAIKSIESRGINATTTELRIANEQIDIARKKFPKNATLSKYQKKISKMLTVKQEAERKKAAHRQEAERKRAALRSFYSQMEIPARVKCDMHIKRRLRSPSTASLVSSSAGLWEGHKNMLLVDVIYDAENAFGARIRSKFQCQVRCTPGNDGSCVVKKAYESSR